MKKFRVSAKLTTKYGGLGCPEAFMSPDRWCVFYAADDDRFIIMSEATFKAGLPGYVIPSDKTTWSSKLPDWQLITYMNPVSTHCALTHLQWIENTYRTFWAEQAAV